jgi:exopolysaccharide biosynthesis protein
VGQLYKKKKKKKKKYYHIYFLPSTMALTGNISMGFIEYKLHSKTIVATALHRFQAFTFSNTAYFHIAPSPRNRIYIRTKAQ